jgi:3-oxoacyl-[acyl-carrier-protein] synthase-3
MDLSRGLGDVYKRQVLHYTGNTSSASIPLALVHAADNGMLKKGDTVLLVGFGAGMTAASAIIKWEGR